jgi:hypothetical protein
LIDGFLASFACHTSPACFTKQEMNGQGRATNGNNESRGWFGLALSIPSQSHMEFLCRLTVDRPKINLATLWCGCVLANAVLALCNLRLINDFGAVRHIKKLHGCKGRRHALRMTEIVI